MFLNSGSKFRYLTSLPRLLRVLKFADFTGTIKVLRLPTIHLASLRFPSLNDTLVVCDGFERRPLTHEKATGIGVPAPISHRGYTRKSQDLPSSRETSIVHLLLFLDPGQIDFSDLYEKSMLFPAGQH